MACNWQQLNLRVINASLNNAHTTEVNSETEYPIIDILPTQKQLLAEHSYGGTMRLGSYAATVKKESKVAALYNATAKLDSAHDQSIVSERHRHRYEVNPIYVDTLEKQGLSFSGYHTAHRWHQIDGIFRIT